MIRWEDRIGKPAKQVPYQLQNQIVWTWKFLEPPSETKAFNVVLSPDYRVIRTEVVLISRRDGESHPWVYLDIGMFNGLAETAEESIRYRIRCPRPHGPTAPAVLAGPTCDSLDVLYEDTPYPLPVDLRANPPAPPYSVDIAPELRELTARLDQQSH